MSIDTSIFAQTANVRALQLKSGRMNSARFLIRREDDEPPRTPTESPFRCFDVKCLKCGSYRLSLTTEFDEEAGELRLVLS